MKKNNLLASMAGKALALAAAMMMSMAFTACSSDDDDTPAPQPEPTFTNTIVLDGVTMPIIDAGIDEDDLNEGHYNIVLFVSENKGVKIMVDKAYHDGNTIDLTKKEPKHDGWYWSVECYNPNLIIDTYGEPGTSYPVFMSGTLSVKSLGSEDGKPVFEIVLKNGKVKGEGEYGDGKEHTISISWKGKAKKIS